MEFEIVGHLPLVLMPWVLEQPTHAQPEAVDEIVGVSAEV